MRNGNRKIQRKLNILYDNLWDYAVQVVEKYRIGEFGDIYFTCYGASQPPKDVDIPPSALMFVNIKPIVDKKTDIIIKLYSHIYLSKEEFLNTLVACNMNFDDTLICLKQMLLHEVGHVIDYRQYVGMQYKEYEEIINNNVYEDQPKMRTNASIDNLIKWNLAYNALPCEAAANNAVGITNEDIINMVKLMNK